MRVINFDLKFTIGASVIVHKAYISSSVNLQIGMKGMVYKITIESVPDMGLYDLRIIHMDFGNQKLNIAEHIAREYFKIT